MPRTAGKVRQSPGSMRLSSQPGLKEGYIWRSSGVTRKSSRVLEQNKKFGDKMRGNSIATTCKGKPRSAFFACLRTEGKKKYGSA